MGHIHDVALLIRLQHKYILVFEKLMHRFELKQYRSLKESNETKIELEVHIGINIHNQGYNETTFVLTPNEVMMLFIDLSITVDEI